MRVEISNRLAGWLRKDGRQDLANQGEAEVSELKYLELFQEVRLQHPEEDVATSHDRTLFRMLTHPELAPTRKQARKFGAEKRERWLRYAWAIAVLILLLLLLVGRGHAQTKAVYQAQGKEPIRAEAQKMDAPETPPALTAEQKLRIRELQRRYDALSLQLLKLQVDKEKLEKQLSDALVVINNAAYEIARESKMDTASWNLNIDSLAWEKRK